MSSQKPLTNGCRVAAIISLLMAAFILVIFIGSSFNENLTPFKRLNLKDSLMMIAFVIVFLGLVSSWWKPLFAGVIILLGLVCFYLLNYLFSSSFPSGPYFLLMAVPAVLLILCHFRKI